MDKKNLEKFTGVMVCSRFVRMCDTTVEKLTVLCEWTDFSAVQAAANLMNFYLALLPQTCERALCVFHPPERTVLSGQAVCARCGC